MWGKEDRELRSKMGIKLQIEKKEKELWDEEEDGVKCKKGDEARILDERKRKR